jgi:hypothetical protein
MRQMLGLNKVIRTFDQPVQVRAYVFDDNRVRDMFAGTSVIHTVGAIHYTDIFKGKWVFRFSRRYNFMRFEDGEIFGGGWEDYGKEEDNGEYPDTEAS